jgi:hypothetical protein
MRSKIGGVFRDFFDFTITANVENGHLGLAHKVLLSFQGCPQ